MTQEGQLLDKKSLRAVTGKTSDWHELAKDCIAFANPKSKIGGIHQRIGVEIPRSRIRRSIGQLVAEGRLQPEGVGSGTRYCVR